MTAVGTSASKRILSIDILRGVVMLLMALDHTRFFFSDFKYDPTDLRYAGAAIFLTRWMTNFCAPVFVLLSGTSAFLSLVKTGSKKEAAFKLFTRGLWLIILEITFVRFGWTFDPGFSHIYLQVIWAIGVSMVALSALIFLPLPAILAVGLLMIFGHNAFDNYQPAVNSSFSILWQFLHISGPVTFGNGYTVVILYPVIPWIGVMATGYCMGPLFLRDEKQRRKTFMRLGVAAVVFFILLRASNVYGDPAAWQAQTVWWRTILSFINCAKYPPSLLFLLMTLGPAFIALALLENVQNWATNILLVYGRVPLFFYLLHIYLIHGLAKLSGEFIHNSVTAGLFPHPGYSIIFVYLFWDIVIAALYLPCRWFMRIKMKHKHWWLSYL